jgi:ribose transport system substrate-binding protein
MRLRLVSLSCLVFISLGLLIAQNENKNANTKSITIGLVGKSQSNPVFMAAYAGARVAAKEVGTKHGVEIKIDWQTPQNENPQEQAQAIEQMSHSGVAGIAVACSNAEILTPAINKAVDLGTQVICFDSDAPKSKRFAYYGSDDVEVGRMEIRELAQVMGEKGVVAILAGNKNAPNLKRRVQSVIEELKNFPSMSLLPNGVFYNEEIPEKSADVVAHAQKVNSQIGGWIFIGGWPLFMKNGIKWNPDQVKIVSCDALPNQLEYLKSGHVQVLIAQGCFAWGYKSVELLLDKVLLKKSPNEEFIAAPLTRVTKENTDEWSLNWKKWLLKEAVYR